jgi:DNA-directed RNA polymerase specialized sigma24 family protein
MNKEKLNTLVSRYQETKDETDFNEIYGMVSASWKSLETVGKSIRADIHEITSLYEDVLLKCIAKYNGEGDFAHFYYASVSRKRTDLYRRKKIQHSRETYEIEKFGYNNEDFKDNRFQLADEFNLEEVALSKKEADQRQLIDSLLSGADETTTAIVETFLQHPKPTPTAIGKQLDIHHSTVIRKLERLAGKFDSKQFGSHTDYLVAL